jgi:hypothetical protein
MVSRDRNRGSTKEESKEDTEKKRREISAGEITSFVVPVMETSPLDVSYATSADKIELCRGTAEWGTPKIRNYPTKFHFILIGPRKMHAARRATSLFLICNERLWPVNDNQRR